MSSKLDRRQVLSQSTWAVASGAALAAGLVSPTAAALAAPEPAATRPPGAGPFRFCLNTSTIRGQKLPLIEEIELASAAGYDAIEPWMNEITQYVEKGGQLADLKKRLEDARLTVESAIGFARWIVDDPAERAQGLEAAKRDMDTLAQIGGKRVAAPPVGATDKTGMNLFAIAERYRALLEAGLKIGVVPQLEVWGFSKTLGRLGETALVAIECGRSEARILPDVYHIYKGGSDFAGLSLLAGKCVEVFHMNDYPADPPREKIADADRVHCGDGVAPLAQILRALAANGSQAVLSLELFNREYWKQDPKQVLATGLEKMRAAVAAAKLE